MMLSLCSKSRARVRSRFLSFLLPHSTISTTRCRCRCRLHSTGVPDQPSHPQETLHSLRRINKSLYDEALKCPRLGWFSRRNRLPSQLEQQKDQTMREFLFRDGKDFEDHVYAHKYGYHQKNGRECGPAPVLSEDCGETPSASEGGVRMLSDLRTAVVEERSPDRAALATRSLMDPPKGGASGEAVAVNTLLQPTFATGNLLARADAVVRTGPLSWEILEIKSATEKSFRKKVPDLAFTVYVARSAGCSVDRASLIMVDPNYVRSKVDDGDEQNNRLYTTIDCTDLVDAYIAESEMGLATERIDRVTGRGSGEGAIAEAFGAGDEAGDDSLPPPVEYKLACGKCELFGVECGPAGTKHNGGVKPRHTIWELPRLAQKRFSKILERSLPTLEIADLVLDSPGEEAILLTKPQRHFRTAVLRNEVVVFAPTRLEFYLKRIRKLGPRVRYLDFEAVSMLRPPYPGMSPYQTMVTQYSLHHHPNGLVGGGDGGNSDSIELAHDEYLADPQKDCRKELLERLLVDLGYDASGGSISWPELFGGPILVYSSYEKTQLTRLAELFPEHAPSISHAIDHRLVDLEKIIRECVSHPLFRGRSSIKVTLPALVPGFEKAYEDLLVPGGLGHEHGYGIADGGAASVAFAEMVSGVRGEGDAWDRTRAALLAYCKLDTLALVEIHKALWNLLDESQPSKAKGEEYQDLQKHTVVELKEMLRERGQKVSGRKAVLIERLVTAVAKPERSS